MKQGYANRQVKDICAKGSSQVAQKDLEGLIGDYPIYGASGLIKNVDFYHQEKEYIGLVKDGSGIGRVMFLPPKSSVIGTIQYILPKEGYNIRYIGYCLQSLKLDKYKQGAAIPHIYFKDYGEAQILVADNPDEQQRIVALLDAEFAKIDALKANAEKNLQNAKDLFQAALKSVYSSIKSTKKLDSIVTIINGFAFKSEDFHKDNPIKAIKITNVGVGHFVETTDTNLPLSIWENKPEFQVREGDIIFALTRTIISDGLKVAIVPKTYDKALLNQRVAALSINSSALRNYLFYYFQTPMVKQYVLAHVNTLMQPNLSINDLRTMPIKIVDDVLMLKIVAHLDALNEKCKTLQANYEKTLNLCDDLKQALLRKAFNGEI